MHETQIYGHSKPNSSKQDANRDRVDGDPSRYPRSRTQLMHQTNMAHNSADVYDHSQAHQCHAGPDRKARGVDREIRSCGADFAQK